MAGLVPATHDLLCVQDVDARDFRREDGASHLLPGHDEGGGGPIANENNSPYSASIPAVPARPRREGKIKDACRPIRL